MDRASPRQMMLSPNFLLPNQLQTGTLCHHRKGLPAKVSFPPTMAESSPALVLSSETAFQSSDAGVFEHIEPDQLSQGMFHPLVSN